jgi:hypothetical protein
MQPLLEVFDSLKRRFGDDKQAEIIIEREIRRTKEWVDEQTPEEPEISHRELGKVEAPTETHGTRSIFDDIDAIEPLEGL